MTCCFVQKEHQVSSEWVNHSDAARVTLMNMERSTDTTELRAAIEAATRQRSEAFARRDAAGCASLYTEQGAMLPPNADIAWGRQAIQAVWQGIFDAGLTASRDESLEVESAGDLAYEMGRYTMYA